MNPHAHALAAELRGLQSQLEAKPGPARDHLAYHQNLIMRERLTRSGADMPQRLDDPWQVKP
jgi:hypothetical protein